MQIQEHKDLQAFNSFAMPCVARFYAAIASLADLRQALEYQQRYKMPLLVLGGGSNVLLPDKFPGLVLHIQLRGIELIKTGTETVQLKVGAGENWHHLVLYCLKSSWYGIENLALIPGTVGAAPIQNIGAYGVELADFFVSLEALDIRSGKVLSLDKEACQFGYRDSVFKSSPIQSPVILTVTLELSRTAKLRTDYKALADALAKQFAGQTLTAELVADCVCAIRRSKLPDPLQLPNAGSFFKNPVLNPRHYQELVEKFPDMPAFTNPGNNDVKVPAAWLLERSGWKGRREGAVGAHSQQPLVIVNYGGARQAEVTALATQMQRSVLEQFGIGLEAEVNVILG